MYYEKLFTIDGTTPDKEALTKIIVNLLTMEIAVSISTVINVEPFVKNLFKPFINLFFNYLELKIYQKKNVILKMIK